LTIKAQRGLVVIGSVEKLKTKLTRQADYGGGALCLYSVRVYFNLYMKR